MKLKALVIAGALLVAGAANAQESYLTNSFNSNLFVGLSAGANASFDGIYGAIKGDGKVSTGVGLGLELSLGKWFTPDLGFRLNLTGIGTSVGNGNIPYYGAGVDLLWDASATFAGYNPDRVVSVVPYLHAGYVKSEGRGAGFGAGIQFPIALSQKWAIVPDFRFVGYGDALLLGSGSGVCASVLALIGVQYKFGKTTNFQSAAAAAAPLAVAVAEAEAAKAEADAAEEKAQAENAALKAEKDKLVAENTALKDELAGAAAENEAIVKNLMHTPACVFFEIGQATLSVKELEHFDHIVKTMIAQGKNITFTVAGHSDKNTGSVRRNKQLAKQRANYIVKLLTGKYNLNKDQFVVKAAGNENVYTTIELNRAVIIEAAE